MALVVALVARVALVTVVTPVTLVAPVAPVALYTGSSSYSHMYRIPLYLFRCASISCIHVGGQ